MIPLSKITSYLDLQLNHSEIHDYPGAFNGLQLENPGRITKIAAAVDSHERILDRCIQEKVDLLITHHGLWWQDPRPLVGHRYRIIQKAIQAKLAVYSSHLPLDLHPQWGNNILFSQALGLKKTVPFLEIKGQPIGLLSTTSLLRTDLNERLKKLFSNSFHFIQAGPEKMKKIAIITGGAGNELAQAHALGADTLITGEGSHWTYGMAHELKMNLIYCGHYATEVFGVQAIAKHLSQKYRLPWIWINDPSGL